MDFGMEECEKINGHFTSFISYKVFFSLRCLTVAKFFHFQSISSPSQQNPQRKSLIIANGDTMDD